MQSQRPVRHRSNTSAFRPPSMSWLSIGIWLALVALAAVSIIRSDDQLGALVALLLGIFLGGKGLFALAWHYRVKHRLDARLRTRFDERRKKALSGGWNRCWIGIYLLGNSLIFLLVGEGRLLKLFSLLCIFCFFFPVGSWVRQVAARWLRRRQPAQPQFDAPDDTFSLFYAMVASLLLAMVFGDTILFFGLLVSILLVSGIFLLVKYLSLTSRFDRGLRGLFNRGSFLPLFGLGSCFLGIGLGCLTILPSLLTDVLGLLLAGVLFLALGGLLAYRGLIRYIQA